MRNWRAGLVMAVALAAATAQGNAEAASDPAKPVHIIIGLDLSRSNPLVTNKEYASKAAQRIAPLIKNLAPRSVVNLRTFGVYDPSAQNLRIDFVVSSKHPVEEVSTVVTGVVAGIPQLVAERKLTAQNYTNIVPFLENMAQVTDCTQLDATIILVSDGIEDSEYVKLIHEGSTLPAPEPKLYKGCAQLQILGLGVGANSPTLTKHLRDEWTTWAQKAGFETFEGLNDW